MRKAAVLVCAVGVLAASGATSAHAQPGEPGEPGGDRDGPGTSLEEVRKEIEDLHDQAGSATDAYNAAAGKVKRQQKRIVRLARRIDRNQGQLDDLTDRAGAMARAQYRGGVLPPGNRMLLERDPQKFLHSLSLMHKGQRATKGVIGELSTRQRQLSGDAKAATKEWKKLEASRKKRAAAKKRIEARLGKAKKLESTLAAEEKKRLRELEEKAARARQMKWLKSGALDGIDKNAEASKAGKKAIAYASEQLGKDYQWGATGPRTFDCSGLTLRAWEAAGVRIPRTSQEQWKGLEKVDLDAMRPGDLIIYKKDASHVGMYLGDGAMLHAPRTGRQIRVEGAGALPILGVVRPDAG